MKNSFLCVALLLTSFTLVAQTIPVTNLFGFDLIAEGNGYRLTNPQFLSAFNASGYNNQPQFFSEHELYITAQMSGTSQTDIFSLNFQEKTLTQVTATAESEYSPTLLFDNKHFSTVRVATDAEKTQQLWQFPLNRQQIGKLLLPEIKNIGYHFWIGRRELLLFIVGSNGAPHQLALANTTTGSFRTLAEVPGRCFQRLPNGNVAYIEKRAETEWYIVELTGLDGSTQEIIRTQPGSEDFAILPDGTILMGYGSKLYSHQPDKAAGWELVGDLRKLGIQQITRMAYNGAGKLVLVGS